MRDLLNRRLNAHFIACAAGLGAGAPQSEAAIVYSGIVNINIPSNVDGVYLNLVTGVFSSNSALVPGWDVNPYGSATLTYFSPDAPVGGAYVIGGGGSGTAPGNLPLTSPVGPASVFGSGNAATTGPLAHVLNSTNNFIGFRFQNEANGNTIHYGWMRIALAGSLEAQPRAIVDYGFETIPGQTITVGFVPAPGALVLLALGAAGMARRGSRGK